MRAARLCICVCLLSVAAACTKTPAPSKPKLTGFVKAQGTGLVLDGKPYRFHGLNYYDMNAPGKENPYNPGFATLRGCRAHFQVPRLDEALAHIGPAANALRSWFFQPYSISVPIGGGPSQRDWSVFDNTLAAVKRAGMKIIVALGQANPDCDIPDRVRKTLDWYRSGYRTEVPPTLVSTYRDYVRQIVGRYRDRNEILMWQLVNEPSANNSDGSCDESAAARALRAFADDVGALIKSIDSNHLVSVGSGHGGCGLSGRNRSNYGLVNGSPGIDVCEHHDYFESAVPLPQILQRELLICAKRLGKPMFVGEVGGIRPLDDKDRVCPARGRRFLVCRARLLKDKFDAQLNTASRGLGADIVGILVWDYCESEWTRCDPANWDVVPGDPVLQVLARLPVA